MITATILSALCAYFARRWFRASTASSILPAVALLLMPLAERTHAQEFKNGDVVRLLLNKKAVDGAVIFWEPEAASVIACDGRWHWFAPHEAEGIRKTQSTFRAFNPAEMRTKLLEEFGSGYDVSGAGRYLVVHPAGQRDVWAPRFDELNRDFVHYFTARGWRPDPPSFSLVAIVFGDKNQYLRYANSEGNRLDSSVIGYYSPRSNRVAMYDITTEHPNVDWQMNAETIIHETAHQLAFNGGLHNRYGETPKWASEGLACYFEARGVWNAGRHRQLKDRVNAYRKQSFEKLLATRPKGLMAEMVQSDRLFQTDPERAYAEAWGLTAFLVETRPRQYFEMLRRVAAAPNFQHYTGPTRLADFNAAFHENLSVLEAKYLQFMRDLPE